jgi:hypothetical protein
MQYPEFSLTDDEIKRKLFRYNDMRDVPSVFDYGVDFIFTHFVLEHFDDLDIFFIAVCRLLTPAGVSLNIIDLSDHTYHIFSKYKCFQRFGYRNSLSHLRYSNRVFSFINDHKCFMNRYLLPTYCKKAADYGLKCRITDKILYDRTVPIHKNLTDGLNTLNEDDLKVMSFRMYLDKT